MKYGWAFAVVMILSLAAHTAQAGIEDNTIRITPDSTKVIHLEQDAASVIVANPAHASVVLDSPRLLVVMPRQPGTTQFTVLDGAGQILLEKNIIVAGTAKPSYVRIRRSCGAGAQNCLPNSYYYCPDGCYEVSPVGAQQGGMQAPPVMSGGSDNSGALATDDSLIINGGATVVEGRDTSLPEVMPPTEPGGGVQIIQPSSLP